MSFLRNAPDPDATAYARSMDAIKEYVRAMLPPISAKLREDGPDYYLRWVNKLSTMWYPKNDTDFLGLTEQLVALQWVTSFLGTNEGRDYALSKHVDPDGAARALRRARFMVTKLLHAHAAANL